jgi:hypothetical protein
LEEHRGLSLDQRGCRRALAHLLRISLLPLAWFDVGGGSSVMESIEHVTERETRGPLLAGAVFALLPFLLALMVGAVVGFGPCGPSIAPSARWLVIVLGCFALVCPIAAAWCFWQSFTLHRVSSLAIGAPLLVFSAFVWLYWFVVVASAL